MKKVVMHLAAVCAFLLSSCQVSSTNASTSSEKSPSQHSSESFQTSSSSSSSDYTSNTSESSSSGTSSSAPTIKRYTITWKNYDGTVLEIDKNVKEGTMPSYDGKTPTRADDGEYTYTFSGWNPTVSLAKSDQTYVATYSYTKIKVTYTIDFDLNGGTSSSYAGSKTIEAFTKNIFFFDCIKEDYNFRGWSYDGKKIFDENGNQLATPIMAANMTFTAIYSQTCIMTITKNIDAAGTITGEGEYTFNTNVDVKAVPNQGYDFVGWYYNGTLLSNTEEYKYMMWSDDVTLEARFALASYTLKIHSNNSDYGLVMYKASNIFDYQESYEVNYRYTNKVTISAYSKTNVRFLGWYDDENNLVATNAAYSFVMPNYDYDLEAKWNCFKVNYSLNGGENDVDNPISYTNESTGLTLKNPTKTGYDFLGWKYSGSYVTSIDPSWMRDVTLEAVWNAHDYSITYNLNGGDNDASNPTSYTIESGEITLLDPSRNGYTFEGWYMDPEFKTEIESIASGSRGDLGLHAKWLIIMYSITYDLAGGTNDDNNPTIYTVESEYTLQPAMKTGYTFEGWYDASGSKVSKIEKGTTGAISLTAKWSATKNVLTVESSDSSKGTAEIISGTGYTDEEIEVKATPNSGCVFMGWYSGGKFISKNETYSFTMPAEDCSLTAKFLTKIEEEKEERLGIKPVFSKNGETVTYGLYPQKNVNDSDLLASLNALDDSAKGSNGWYLYENAYYAKLSFAKNNYYEFDNGTTIEWGATYWFKCEPITWNVLENNDGEYYLLSSVLLDDYYYYTSKSTRTINGKTIYPNNYEYSSIREWLNGDFYDTAFALGGEHIQRTMVDNGASTTDTSSNPYVCNNTEDNVFLPSYKDYTNSDFGLNSSSKRECKTTDWARARVARMRGGSDTNGFYWTRSPTSFSETGARNIDWNGELYSYNILNYTSVAGPDGVRPSIRLKVS